MADAAFQTPYTRSPGSSTPGPHVGPQEGTSELWGFFWLALLNTLVIAVTGVVTWWLIH